MTCKFRQVLTGCLIKLLPKSANPYQTALYEHSDLGLHFFFEAYSLNP